MMNRSLIFIGVILLAGLLSACASQDEKRMKFYKKGQILYEKGDYVKASVEFKNALQIDPKFTEGYFMLGMAELRRRKFKMAYGRFSKALELSPAHLNSHLS